MTPGQFSVAHPVFLAASRYSMEPLDRAGSEETMRSASLKRESNELSSTLTGTAFSSYSSSVDLLHRRRIAT